MKKLILCLSVIGALAFVQNKASAFTLQFDENGNGLLDGVKDIGFAATDPNTGINALTYRLPNTTISGIEDVLSPTGDLSDAMSFYNVGQNGYMAYYSAGPGTDLADTISGGVVPRSGFSIVEVGDGFVYNVGNVYIGTSSDSAVPETSSTLMLLSGAVAGLFGISRKSLRLMKQ